MGGSKSPSPLGGRAVLTGFELKQKATHGLL